MPGLYNTGYYIQDFAHAKQALYQLSRILSPTFNVLSTWEATWELGATAKASVAHVLSRLVLRHLFLR